MLSLSRSVRQAPVDPYPSQYISRVGESAKLGTKRQGTDSSYPVLVSPFTP